MNIFMKTIMVFNYLDYLESQDWGEEIYDLSILWSQFIGTIIKMHLLEILDSFIGFLSSSVISAW